MPTLHIQNGTILDPAQKLQRKADLLLRDGKVAAIGTNLGKADEVIDARDCFVTPGLIDIHVHFREPGDEEEETTKLPLEESDPGKGPDQRLGQRDGDVVSGAQVSALVSEHAGQFIG